MYMENPERKGPGRPRKSGIAPDESTRNGRLDAAISRFGSARKLFQATGIAESTIKKYRREPASWRPDLIERMAEAMGIDADWLWAGGNESVARDSTSAMVSVPYYDARASAGYGRVCDTMQTGSVQFPRQLVVGDMGLKPSSLVIVTADGDSMLPTIRSGDRLMIDTSQVERIEGVYAVVMRGSLFVKRVSRTDAGFLVQSDNTLYPPETFPVSDVVVGPPEDGQSLAIIGRVVLVMHQL